MVWPGSAMTRLTRSVFAGPGQWSRGGWWNTTMSPWWTSCQLKNAFHTRIRSPMSSVGSMDELGIEKTWNTNARAPSASSDAIRRVTAHPVRERRRRRAGGAPASPGTSPAGFSGAPLRSAVLAIPALPAAVRRLRRPDGIGADTDGDGGRGAGGAARHVVTAAGDWRVGRRAAAGIPGDRHVQ